MPDSSLVWSEMDLDAVSLDFNRLFPEYSFDGKAVLALIMQGKLWEAVRQIGHGMTGLLGSQLGEIRTLFVTILVLGILAALFTNFADLFRNHQVSELAFYFVYLLLIAVLLKSFVNAAQIVQEILTDITTFMRLYIPTYMIAVGSASGIASASVYYQILLVVVYLVEWGYLSVLVPVVYSYVLLTVINGVWMEEKLSLLLELIEKIIGVSLKVTIGIVTGFSLLQSMITPALDSLQNTALKKAVSAIPGIGGLTEGMFEMVMGSAVLIKGSVGIYITLVLLGLCCIPVLKILLLSCVTKLSAAMIGIISDKRLTNCADRMGNGNLMLLKLALSSAGMFIIQIAIITYSTGKV
jgi:stage III sporulation protein AE